MSHITLTDINRSASTLPAFPPASTGSARFRRSPPASTGVIIDIHRSQPTLPASSPTSIDHHQLYRHLHRLTPASSPSPPSRRVFRRSLPISTRNSTGVSTDTSTGVSTDLLRCIHRHLHRRIHRHLHWCIHRSPRCIYSHIVFHRLV